MLRSCLARPPRARRTGPPFQPSFFSSASIWAAVSVRRSIWSSSTLKSSLLELELWHPRSHLASRGQCLRCACRHPTSPRWWRHCCQLVPGRLQLGPIFAIAQTVAKPSMRALASAFMLLTAAGFGRGIGPLAVGMLNGALKNDYGAEAVRHSLVSAAATSTLGTLLFIWAARSIRGDIFSGRANSIGSPPPIPFVFIIVLIPAHVPATRSAAGRSTCM